MNMVIKFYVCMLIIKFLSILEIGLNFDEIWN